MSKESLSTIAKKDAWTGDEHARMEEYLTGEPRTEGPAQAAEAEACESRTEELPCTRSPGTDPDGAAAWNCDNDHTGCVWNDGHNTCMHDGKSLHPLEEDDG